MVALHCIIYIVAMGEVKGKDPWFYILQTYKKYFILSSLLIALYTAWTCQTKQHKFSSHQSATPNFQTSSLQIRFDSLCFLCLKTHIAFHMCIWVCVGEGEGKGKTCSLEITRIGPMFTDTYFPLLDNVCFTQSFNGGNFFVTLVGFSCSPY